MNNFWLRVVFGSLYVGLWTFTAYAGDLYLSFFIAFLSFLGIRELYILSGRPANMSFLTPLFYGAIIVFFALYQDTKILKLEYLFAFGIQVVALLGQRYFLNEKGIVNLSLGTLYIWLPLASLALWFVQNPENHFTILLLYLTTIWVYDSMAYVVGKKIGKRPIFPKVSPKKTVEGTIGGFIATVLFLWILNVFVFQLPQVYLGAAAIAMVAGVYGDYFESYAKRKLKVKDSSSLIPGHGGILDRLDSILFSALPFVIYVTLLDI